MGTSTGCAVKERTVSGAIHTFWPDLHCGVILSPYAKARGAKNGVAGLACGSAFGLRVGPGRTQSGSAAGGSAALEKGVGAGGCDPGAERFAGEHFKLGGPGSQCAQGDGDVALHRYPD